MLLFFRHDKVLISLILASCFTPVIFNSFNYSSVIFTVFQLSLFLAHCMVLAFLSEDFLKKIEPIGNLNLTNNSVRKLVEKVFIYQKP